MAKLRIPTKAAEDSRPLSWGLILAFQDTLPVEEMNHRESCCSASCSLPLCVWTVSFVLKGYRPVSMGRGGDVLIQRASKTPGGFTVGCEGMTPLVFTFTHPGCLIQQAFPIL